MKLESSFAPKLYLSGQGDKLVIKSRTASLKEAIVSINNKGVGDQGMISLSDASQVISFKATAKSGHPQHRNSSKNVEFKDITIGKDGKSLIIEAQGSEPAVELNVIRLASGNWRTAVPIERPVLTFKAREASPSSSGN